MAAGLIPDPYLDSNEAALTWLHRVDWQYSTTFQAQAPQAGERVDLVFDGIDTVATVELNGDVLGHTVNMHRGYRFDVGAIAARRRQRPDRDAAVRAHPRRAGGGRARLAPAGLPAPVQRDPQDGLLLRLGLGTRPPDRRPVETRTAGTLGHRPADSGAPARHRRRRRHGSRRRAPGTGPRRGSRLHRAGHGRRPRGTNGDHRRRRARHRSRAGRPVVVAGGLRRPAALRADHRRCWPTAGQVDTVRRRIGFRTVTVDTEPDEFGTPFVFVVNGKRVFAKGANWIPDDHFLTRVTRERLARRIDQAVGANMNMLRVWGGGIYETDDFYDACDERGVMVWQDFPFSCAYYAEEEPLRGEVEAEARENVTRLVAHPSLVLWNGNNENLPAYTDWGWQDALEGRSWGARLLPRTAAQDRRRARPHPPVRAGQPVQPRRPAAQRRPPRHPPRLGRLELPGLHPLPRPHPAVLRRVRLPGATHLGHPHPLDPRRAVDAHLARVPAPPEGPTTATSNLDRGLAPHLPVPDDFEQWHWATQLNQARAVAFGVEHYRSWWPRTAGSPGLAAQRLLAGHLVVGHRQRRTAQAPLLRPQARVRATAADRPAPRGTGPPWSRSTTTTSRGRVRCASTRQDFAGRRAGHRRAAARRAASIHRACWTWPTTSSNPPIRRAKCWSRRPVTSASTTCSREDRDLRYDPAPFTADVTPVDRRVPRRRAGHLVRPGPQPCWPTRWPPTRSSTTCSSR